MPPETCRAKVAPLAATMNALLERLRAAFEAERSLAANTAHELRTPLAGAIAQAQRIRKETAEPQTAQRGADIEATLKRLTARAERLMQLARAEGGRLNMDQESDLRDTVDVLIGDMRRNEPIGRILWKNVVTGASGVFFETPEEVWRGLERGLQSMVWDPDAAENGFFYVNYNDVSGANVVARFHATSPTSGDPSSRHVILKIGQGLANHQSHWLGFGPADGYLYIAAGDGGGSNDPDDRAQTICLLYTSDAADE